MEGQLNYENKMKSVRLKTRPCMVNVSTKKKLCQFFFSFFFNVVSSFIFLLLFFIKTPPSFSPSFRAEVDLVKKVGFR